MKGISSAQLIRWFAPVDIAEQYEIYLLNIKESNLLRNNRYCNCSFPKYGPKCEYYSYDISGDFSSTVPDIFSTKSKIFHLASIVPCYIHISCIRGPKPLCLDWREICNGKKDCINGEDEVECWKIEANTCAENEYQCHDGHCIPQSFYQDTVFSPDCADGSDEINFEYENCAVDPTFRCEEHTCYPLSGAVRFPCGDGQCITKLGKCVNKRHDISFRGESSLQSNLSNDCWTSMACLTSYNQDFDGKDCGFFCWATCAEEIIKNCPEYIQFPEHPIISHHVYLVYARNTSHMQSETIGDPVFICYNPEKCTNDLQSFMPSFGRHCLQTDRLNITFSLSDIWDKKIAIIARAFNDLCKTVSIPYQCANKTLYRCSNTKKCVSIHRLIDGIIDCEEGDDETFEDSCSLRDVAGRFRCYQEEKCLSQRLVNNYEVNCKGGDDEIHPHKRLSRYQIHFPIICDGFQELEPILIDGQNETDETSCEMWQCNNTYTHCDGIWNCKDGIDEIGCVNYSLKCLPTYHHCVNRTTGQITCLPRSMINNGEVDCLGGTDEVYHCQKLERNSCSPVTIVTPNCYYQLAFTNFRCWNDSRCIDISKLSCQGILSCPSGTTESKLLCYYIGFTCPSRFSNSKLTDVEKFFCAFKSRQPKWAYQHFQLSARSLSNQLLASVVPQSVARRTRQVTNLKEIWPCHRGIRTLVQYNLSAAPQTKCLCPPSYFGDFCEYQSERVSLSIQLQIASEWNNVFTLVYYLINNLGEMESYDQLHYRPMNYCKGKINRYLLYSSRPKNPNRTYYVHFEIYDRQKLEYRAGWRFPLRFPFLPVQRLVLQLRVPFRHTECLLDCGIHGQCISFVNTEDIFCRCESGWTGERCEQPNQITCNCAPNSLCLLNQICICPQNKYGQRCYLSTHSCPQSFCINGGTCINVEKPHEYMSTEFVCFCPEGFIGRGCKIVLNQIIISFHDLVIPSLILLHFIEVREQQAHQRMDTFKKVPLNEETILIYVSFNYQILFAEFLDSYYLIYLARSNASTTTEVKLNPQDRCPSIKQIFEEAFSTLHPLRRIKYYHIPCQMNLRLRCFYDEYYMCLCDDARRANCLTFDHNITYTSQENYGYCEYGAHFFQNNEECPSASMCLCPKCYYGSKCQFSTDGFAVSLETVLGYHIRSHAGITRQTFPVKITVGLTTIIFILGTMNSFLSILTFQTPETQTVGCGLYLLEVSFISLLSICIFTWNYIFLLLSQMKIITNHSFLNTQCLLSEFLLRVFLNYGDWLIACVAVERGTTVFQGTYFNRSKSRQVAKRVSIILLFFIACTTIHDPFHRQLMRDEDEQRIWCIVRYSTNLQILNHTTHLVHLLVPFSINSISALVIIVLTARLQSNINKNLSFKQNLIKQFYARKHLLISPITLVILALPRVVIAFLSDCMQPARDPYLPLVAHFISIIPSLLVFVLFVLTSKIYRKALRKFLRRYFIR